MKMDSYHHHAGKWRAHGVMLLLLLALMVRSVIPMGYMPDTNALRDGRVVITFCITPGSTLVAPATLAGLLAENSPQPEKILAGNECPFSLFSHQGLDLPVLSAIRVLSVGFFSTPVLAFNNTALPISAARGPPLGSRGPPVFFS